jgi:hypothetical protein
MKWRIVILSAVVAAGACAALLPVRFASREELFEIPQGTWERRRSGDMVDILPSEIRLMVGVHDVLVLSNQDDVPQIFGPTLIMPRQKLRLPFDEVSEYQFNCTAHASGQLSVIVEALPASAWERLRWRASRLAQTLQHLPSKTVLHGQAQKSPSPAAPHLSAADRLVGRSAEDP